MTQGMLLSISMLSSHYNIPRLRISNWHLCEVWAYSNGHNCGLCEKTVGGISVKDLVNKNCFNNQKLTPIWNLSLLQQKYLWVVPDDNSARKQGAGDRARIISVDNNYLKNQQLTALWTLRLFQWTEMWVVPDDNSARKKGVEYRGRIWLIITASATINWHLCDVWAYINGQKYGLCLMIIPRKIRGWKIGQDLVGRSIITV